MTKGDVRRNTIFSRYAENLNLLKANGFLPDVKPKFGIYTYICPICTLHFSLNDLDTKIQNHLTLEDAPPKSLDGKANILTCKVCNNECGHKIDFHLVESMKMLDVRNNCPNTEASVKMKNCGLEVNSVLSVEEDSKIISRVYLKSNNPNVYNEFISKTGKKSLIKVQYSSKVIPENMQSALLKTGYLLAFEKLGYAFVLNKQFDECRHLIRSSNENKYPINFCFEIPPLKCGVYFVLDKKYEALVSIFSLKTFSSERFFLVILPLIYSFKETLLRIDTKSDKSGNFILTLYPIQEPYCISDLETIQKMIKWESYIKLNSQKI